MRHLANIYPLSRLVHASPPDWERLLAAIEEGKKLAYSYYLPAREAIVRLCAKEGKDRDRILNDMRTRCREMGGARSPIVLRDNERAFLTFEAAFYSKIGCFSRSLLREPQPGIPFEELLLLGSPHMEVTDSKGRTRYVYLCCGNRKDPDLKAYLQLLSVIVWKHYGAHADSVWCLDLHSGKEFRWRPSARLDNRCRKTAQLYKRLINAMET
jgi:hypothetical protein